nr:GNAT family N-acetyltransferase [Planosporangium mesophilum]
MTIEHRSPHLRRYLAYLDGRPAAAAGLYTTGQHCYFAGAATLPGMRGHGCQSALIRRRLQDAAAMSGQSVVVTTAFSSPSQANLQRLGFALVHTRALWRRLGEP